MKETPSNTSDAANLKIGRTSLQMIEEESEIGGIDDPTIDRSTRRRVFFHFVMGNLFLNYDTGVIPACLLQIERDLKLGY